MIILSHTWRTLRALLIGCWLMSYCPTSRAQNPESTANASIATPQAAEASEALDQITAVPNRPTFSTTAEAVQPGVFEIEYGMEAAEGHENINGLLKFGLTKNLEVRFGNNPIERDFGVTGRGDSGAGFKYKVFSQKKWMPTFSVLYTATIPTATAEVGAGAVGHSAGIMVSKDFGKHHFDFNETEQWLGRPGGSGFDRDYFTALAYFRALSGEWGVTVEVADFSRTTSAAPATMTIMGAATYSLSSRLVLDSGVYFAAYGNLPRATFFAGVTYSVGDLYHRRSRK